jgi:HK97 gp10 family phage protein
MQTTRIVNKREILEKLKTLRKKTIRNKAYGALRTVADHVLAEAITRAPFKTGALVNSLKIRGNKKNLTMSVYADYPNTGVVRKTTTRKQKAGSPEYYAVVLEYGSKHIRAHPYLMPALESKSREIEEYIEQIVIKQAIKDALKAERDARARGR